MTESPPRRREDVVVGELNEGEETAVLDLATAHVVSLNPTAAAIWYLCNGNRDATAIARELIDALPDVEPSQLECVEADVRTMLDQLAGHGLLA
jgi:hypothetical protein